MPKDGGKASKKSKIKISAYTPTTLDAPPPPLTDIRASTSRTLQTTKLKSHTIGGFKLATQASASGMCAPDVKVNDSRTTEEILASWLDAGEEHGWDPAYIDSYLERDLRPPLSDPEESEGLSEPKRPTGEGDRAKHEWKKHIDMYLQRLIILEGRGESPPKQCIAAFPATMLGYSVESKWNGHFFLKVQLKSLGMRIQLGHVPGEVCPKPESAWGDDFVVIDTDGVHNVGLDFCTCGSSTKSHVEQLLDRRLYPATTINPKSAATFRVLEVFELLQYESKVSPYELYNTISRLTDNTGLTSVKVCLGPISELPSISTRMAPFEASEAGNARTRSTRTASETKEGECALLCPPCPHPTINMPEGWEDEPEETRYIHALNLALDACFRLKRKDVSSEKADPGLSNGFSYFVKQSKFNEYLEEHKDEVEPKSNCSRHDAVNLADVSPGQGYAASGVATVECARHNMKRPAAVCDLQKGERYCNMDFILHWGIVVLALGVLRTFFISYDIACQWSKYLMSRLAKIDTNAPMLKPETKTRFMVPKFHLPAHIVSCHTKFAFMNTPGAGLGDGEAPERGWGEANPLAPSTREMGPGTRRDTLDYNFGDYNWRKIIDLGASLGKKMDTALSKVAENTIAHQELEETLDPTKVQEWAAQMAAWERDPVANPNPFEMTVSSPTQIAVRRVLADEEAADIASGKDAALSPDTPPSVLISRGLDLEAEQCIPLFLSALGYTKDIC
ncbi:hypothetical protein DFP72DRAFT_850145 [Ephemerocybe angulata]|uniref:CxC2-like cysteine cluster KDZ transposase-associated domain-containing protein n=1 Tax=Ephemerocybe angulata TaxID=980116 RepID=A0A8H6HTZ8_9AGAR|nr:hypothetical protein DFP72DRAFT_850145 [Tulosesus angulatus]